MRLVLDRGDAGRHGGAVDVEGPADAVDRVDDVGRRLPSSRAADWPGRRSSRRCASSPRSRWWRRVRGPPRNRCGGHIRHRPRRAPAARAAAGPRAGASPRRTAGRCRSGCWGWRGRRSWSCGVTRARIASTSAVRSFSGATTGAPPAARMAIVDQEAVLGEDALVARADIGVGEQRQQFVGARAADDPGRDRARIWRRSPRAARWRRRPGRARAVGGSG